MRCALALLLVLVSTLSHAADLSPESHIDPPLQAGLVALDAHLRAELGIPKDQRSCGVVELDRNDAPRRLAWIRPDAMDYAASVPKICILLSWFAAHPEATPDAETQRELELMIKRSDNELAAKYSQLAGLEAIQKLQREYGLYEEATGGGLWCGKHYGSPTPRLGDPLKDLSHAATVRQCLRFYLLLAQGKLVSPEASERMRRVFEAPGLEFWDSSFVRGLKGRELSLIRKSGWWEDWHLDTAWVTRADREYLLAGMVHHPKGEEYLARLAAGIDDLLAGGEAAKRPGGYHALHRFGVEEGQLPFAAGRFEDGARSYLDTVSFQLPGRKEARWISPVIEAHSPFNEVLPSWNLAFGGAVTAVFELRVGRRFDGHWSPWLFVGDHGEATEEELRTECEDGKIDVDYFRSDKRFDRVQVRLRVRGYEDARLESLALCLSDRTGLPHTLLRWKQPPTIDEASWSRRLSVPFRSQKTARPELAGRICSPTSVSMVLAHHGVEVSPSGIAALAYDQRHDLYGNWPRCVQAAFEFGATGYVTRLTSFAELKAHIARGQPVIASIRVEEGELPGAPYQKTDGHLIVLTGFDGPERVTVNDPAAASAAEGVSSYATRDLERVWLARTGGTSYVILPPAERPVTTARDAAGTSPSWPAWRGAKSGGSTPAGRFRTSFGASEGLAWKVPLPGKGCSTPVVDRGQIILTAPIEGRDAVLTFDLEGKRLWATPLGQETGGKHRNGSGSNPSAVVEGDEIFAYFKSGRLAGLDREGQIRWQTNLRERFGKDTLYWDVGNSPVLTERFVIAAVLQERGSYLAAFHRKTGLLAWKVDRNYETPVEGDHGYATPIVLGAGESERIVVWGAEHLTAHRAQDGEVIWSAAGFNPEKKGNWVTVASAVVAGDVAIVPYGRGARIAGIRLGGEGDVTESHRLWTREGRGGFVPSPCALGNRVLLLADRGELTLLDAKTGASVLEGRLPKHRASYYASPLLAGDLVFAPREDGVVQVARLGKEVEQVAENDLGERLIASPVPIGDRLLFRGEKHLFCVEAAD